MSCCLPIQLERCAAKEYARDIRAPSIWRSHVSRCKGVTSTTTAAKTVRAAVDDVRLYCSFYFRFSATDQANTLLSLPVQLLLPLLLLQATCELRSEEIPWFMAFACRLHDYMIFSYYNHLLLCTTQYFFFFSFSVCRLPACLHSCTLSSAMFAKHQSLLTPSPPTHPLYHFLCV